MKVLESKTELDQALAIQLAQHFHHNDFGWIVANNLDSPNWTTRKERDLCIGEFVREYRERFFSGEIDNTIHNTTINHPKALETW